MKSVRTDPRNHAAEGDERIRTAVPAPSTDPAYDLHRDLQVLVAAYYGWREPETREVAEAARRLQDFLAHAEPAC